MTAKEKAHELIYKFIIPTRSYNELDAVPKDDFETAQDCALIAVAEIITDYKNITLQTTSIQDRLEFWVMVRVELEVYKSEHRGSIK